MSYSAEIGFRYLRSKKRATVSVITVIAITGVALGVGALLAVMSIAAGFQDEFRDKVLGVNAHVLVLKYGLDFEEYRDVVAHAQRMPEVAGAAPFIINEMMLARGERISGVLVKGVDPELMPSVLDLPSQLVEGTLDGLRLPGAKPPVRPSDFDRDMTENEEGDLDAFLAKMAEGEAPAEAGAAARAAEQQDAKVDAPRVETQAETPDASHPPEGFAQLRPGDQLPAVDVPTPEEMEAALSSLELGELPSDEFEEQRFADAEAEAARRDRAGLPAKLPGIVIGRTLAENLDIHLGDQVRVVSPLSGLDTSLWRPGVGAAPRSRDFEVKAVFQAGFQEYDSRLVYTDLYEAQSFYDQGDTVTGVEITLHDLEKAGDIALRLERDLGAGPFHTLDWKELNHNLFTALRIQKVMLSLVITTIIFVAAFNVIATLIMIVLEKRREIAILKAMGATDGGVMKVFMVQGMAIGIVGTAIGLLIGGAACAYLSAFEFPLDPKVYLIDHLPLRVSALEFALTVLISLGICAAATLIPSWWAARLLPTVGIRYQ